MGKHYAPYYAALMGYAVLRAVYGFAMYIQVFNAPILMG
jgi:hypothetical protein